MSYNFHIGQDVVALKDHSQGAFKKNEVFTIYGISISECICKHIMLDIGKKHWTNIMACSVCYSLINKNSSSWLFNDSNFAPLDELTDISELQEVLEQPLFQVK